MRHHDELPAFIRRHFRTVWSLDILMFLRRRGETAWSVEEVARELRANPPLVRSAVETLERAGLVRRHGATFQFAPARSVMTDLCDALDAAYRERPVAVINLICAPDDRLQQLADAFRFRTRGP